MTEANLAQDATAITPTSLGRDSSTEDVHFITPPEATSGKNTKQKNGKNSTKKRGSNLDLLEQRMEHKWCSRFESLRDWMESKFSDLAQSNKSSDVNTSRNDNLSDLARSRNLDSPDHRRSRISSPSDHRRSRNINANEMHSDDDLSLHPHRQERHELLGEDDESSTYASKIHKSVFSLSDSSDSESDYNNRFKNCRLSKDNRDILFEMFGSDAVPSKSEKSRTGLVLDKSQEEVLNSVWRCPEPNKLSTFKLESLENFTVSEEFKPVLKVPSLDPIVDSLLKDRYGSKASYKDGHSLYSTSYKNIEKLAFKGQSASSVALTMIMYLQQGLGKLLSTLKDKDPNIDAAVQSTKDIFAIASHTLDQTARAGAFHHLVRRRATLADTGIDRKIPDIDKWDLPLTGEGVIGKDFESKLKTKKEVSKNILDLLSDDKDKNKQLKRKSVMEFQSFKRPRREYSPKRKQFDGDRYSSTFQSRRQYKPYVSQNKPATTTTQGQNNTFRGKYNQKK